MIWPIVWKEWQEQRWKMVFGTVMLLCFGGSLMVSNATSDKEVVSLLCFVGGVVLALYSAMGVFASETVNGTAGFLKSKPVAGWKVFLCKWFFGWLNFIVPLVVSFFCLRAWDVSWFSFFGKFLFVSIAITTMFYTLTCCLSPRKSSEAFVGFIGLVIAFAIFFYTFLTLEIMREKLAAVSPIFCEMVVYASPMMFIDCITLVSGLGHLPILFVEQGLLFAFVMWIGIRKWERGM